MRMTCPIGPGRVTRSSRSLRPLHMVASPVSRKASKPRSILADYRGWCGDWVPQQLRTGRGLL
jgi:hypothetical protein